MNTKSWWKSLLFVFVIGIAGVMYMGVLTYQDAPPICNFVDDRGELVVTAEQITQGQIVFQKYALMNYGSMFGDGAGRGPDFTAEGLHIVASGMREFYRVNGCSAQEAEFRAIADLKNNGYDKSKHIIVVSQAQHAAYGQLKEYVLQFFSAQDKLPRNTTERMLPSKYISDENELADLSSFIFWGAWVCSAKRPGFVWSYTHNWPFDPVAGNLPTSPTLLWSVFGCFGLVLGIGMVLYARGKLDGALIPKGSEGNFTYWAIDVLDNFQPTKTQQATYKFFATAVVLFLLQVLAGALTIHDFIGLTSFGQIDIAQVLPITIVRSWHLQLSLLWISSCWIGASIFLLPLINKDEPSRQLTFINLLYACLVVVTLGDLVGTYLGPLGKLGSQWHLLGNQGWEFVELGKLWQGLLFGCFALWAYIIYRGIKPSLVGKEPLALPNWLFYSVLSILVLFISGFVATPKTNFVVADFWRWCVIHMWVEAFFEVFTTALVAYFLFLMGLVSKAAANRTVFLVTLLFLGSGILGISHNFYWNAKPVITLAIGSIFSTLQVIPLIILSLEAWKFKNLPKYSKANNSKQEFGQAESFQFLIAVNFWNFFGAGVFGFIINLPIVNYYEHGTYLTVNHGHAALMGVYGNLSIAAMLFCVRYLISSQFWAARLFNCAFWSLNIGLMLMVVLDLFPVGIYQLIAVLDNGLWWARSQEFIKSVPFQTFTWMRAVGGYLFLLGGVIPIVWFMLSSLNKRKATVDHPLG
jgi:nitric oxide reductase subunit B